MHLPRLPYPSVKSPLYPHPHTPRSNNTPPNPPPSRSCSAARYVSACGMSPDKASVSVCGDACCSCFSPDNGGRCGSNLIECCGLSGFEQALREFLFFSTAMTFFRRHTRHINTDHQSVIRIWENVRESWQVKQVPLPPRTGRCSSGVTAVKCEPCNN
jgi:hypothetical protein